MKSLYKASYNIVRLYYIKISSMSTNQTQTDIREPGSYNKACVFVVMLQFNYHSIK